MEIEIKIGREETGSNAITVPATCKKASRHHATLLWKDGIVTIEDNESANGTFVNGRRIAKTQVSENDAVWLGGTSGAECYQVDMKKVFGTCREAESKARTDYSAEFVKLKQAYMDYQAEVAELKKKATQSSQMPRLLASLVPAVIGLIILLVSNDMTMRIVSMSVGSVLSGVVGILTMGKSSSVNEKMNEGITELQIKYQPRYCCPKCGQKIPLTTHWRKLEAEGKCPNPKCDAQFLKH